MADALLRELERKWRESGQLEDEAEWLRARLRAGELPSEHLEFAARLGHGASASALGTDRVLEVGVQIEAAQGAAYLRALVGLARHELYASCDWNEAEAVYSLAVHQLHLAEEYLVAPTEQLADELLVCAKATAEWWCDVEPDQSPPPVPLALWALLTALGVVLAPTELAATAGEGWAHTQSDPQFQEVFAEALAGDAEPGWVPRTPELCADLVPWLLGYSDPLAERVRGRAAEVASLKQRVASGELSRARLDLAAYLGHEAAGLASSSRQWLVVDCERRDGDRYPYVYATDLYLAQIRDRGGPEAVLRALWTVWRGFAAGPLGDPALSQAEELFAQAIANPDPALETSLQATAGVANLMLEDLPLHNYPSGDAPHRTRIPFLFTVSLAEVLVRWIHSESLPTWFTEGGLDEQLRMQDWVGRIREIEDELTPLRARFVRDVASWALYAVEPWDAP